MEICLKAVTDNSFYRNRIDVTRPDWFLPELLCSESAISLTNIIFPSREF
jgi:hypothetical protein